MIRSLLPLILLATSAPAVAAVDGPNRTFTGADLFNLETASDPQFSPDGSKIAYVRRSNDIMTDRTRSTIWIVDVKNGQQTPLVAVPGNHMSPRWSPDGGRLAYVSTGVAGEAPQLYVRWMANGETAKVTGLPESPGSITWSPDGRRLAYVMTVPGEGMKLGSAPPHPSPKARNGPIRSR